MRIEVRDGSFGDQTRAYAEYRIFSSLKNFADIVQRATVTLIPGDSGLESPADVRVMCHVTIHLTEDRSAEASATGKHAYGAIDRVAARMQSLLKGRHT